MRGHEVVSDVGHAESRDDGPGGEGEDIDGDASEEEVLKGEDDGGVLNLDPSKLEGGLDTD